ncbi:CLUMA_CG005015, isoform A [Clunio marinus]|uniref:CLUMA_CG005015, isoform A n=1 Tax=Clunio marinus TaxID=568069 RepID=A0A1J1HXU3_9DIPT|nr:CLUMA_CG005015, isoform A [Clunio marinus]
MSRNDILRAFKILHRIVQQTFEGDKRAIVEARHRINLEFRKNSTIKEQEVIHEKLKIAKDVGDILKHQVVQAVKNPESDHYELKLRNDTAKLDNVIFKEDAIIPEPRSKKCKPDAS